MLSDPVPNPIPNPSAELVLVAALATAMARAVSKSKRRRFIDSVGRLLEISSERSRVVRIRAPRFDPEVARAHAEAVTWWRSVSGAIAAEADRD